MAEKSTLSNILTKKINEILEYKKTKFITKQELVELIDKYINFKSPLKIINNLKKQKRLISIKRNVYLYSSKSLDSKKYVSEFDINEAYLEGHPYYIGLLNAYNYYKFTTQLSNKLFIFNTKYNIEKEIFNFKIKYIKIDKKDFFGISRKGSYFYSDLEKTVIDVLQYFKYVDKLENIIDNFIKNRDLINIPKLILYAKKYKSIKLLKLIGLISDDNNLYNYLYKKGKLEYYTKIRNSGSIKRYSKWKIKLI